MHEMSIATSLVKIALEAAEKEGEKNITEIDVSIGQLAGVMIDSFRFCFDAIKESTPLGNSRLTIHEIPGKAVCSDCKNESNLNMISYLCPNCGSFGLKITQGEEIQIQSITVD